MTAEEFATEGFVDREIAHLREELRAIKELWAQQVASDAATLILRTAEIEKDLLALNHAHKAAREMAATTVDSKGYEVRMTELQVQLQAIKDTARDALGVSVADFARQLASALDLVSTNKEEIEERFNTLSMEVKQDVARRAGAAEVTSAEAKTAAGKARSLSVTSAIISGLAAATAIAAALWKFLKGGAP